MKKSHIISSIVGLHIFLVTLQIHKHSNFIKLTYHKQYLQQSERKLTTLKHERDQQLAALSNPTKVQTFSEKHLGLTHISLRQLQRLCDEERI
jgi:hypothetical protein